MNLKHNSPATKVTDRLTLLIFSELQLPCVDNPPAAIILVQHKPDQHFIGCSCTEASTTFSLSSESAAAQ